MDRVLREAAANHQSIRVGFSQDHPRSLSQQSPLRPSHWC